MPTNIHIPSQSKSGDGTTWNSNKINENIYFGVKVIDKEIKKVSIKGINDLANDM